MSRPITLVDLRVQSHELGVFKGKCGVIAPAKEMNALTGVACTYGGTGTELITSSLGRGLGCRRWASSLTASKAA